MIFLHVCLWICLNLDPFPHPFWQTESMKGASPFRVQPPWCLDPTVHCPVLEACPIPLLSCVFFLLFLWLWLPFSPFLDMFKYFLFVEAYFTLTICHWGKFFSPSLCSLLGDTTLHAVSQAWLSFLMPSSVSQSPQLQILEHKFLHLLSSLYFYERFLRSYLSTLTRIIVAFASSYLLSMLQSKLAI